MSASTRFIVITLLIAFAAQVALYWPTIYQLPFGDDWGPPLTEVARGERVGPVSFFTETRQPDSYRPLQSLLIWLFGRVGEPACWPSIRVLHFLSSAGALAVLGLLLRQWRFGRAGVVVAAAAAALHPSLVAPVGSIDGFSSLLSCAAVWWGIWMMGLTTRPAVGIACACVALILGTLVKEYAFAMGPMAVLFAWMFYNPRWRSAILTAVVLGALTFFLLWVRRYTKPTDMESGPDFEVDSIFMVVQNAALVLIGGFFFGDSLWTYVARSPLAIGVAGATFAATVALLCVGLHRRLVRATLALPAHGAALLMADDEERATPASPLRNVRWAVAFLVLSIPGITFPANLVMKVSEMYLCGLVFTVALLAAFAADGIALDPSRGRRVAAAFLTAVLALGTTLAVRHKLTAMVALGERAKIMTDTLRDEVSRLPDGSSIALLFRKDQVPPRATFSSFRLPDCFLVRPPAVDYLFPGRRITLVCPSTVLGAPLPLLADEAAVLAHDRSIADVVLYWDVAAARFTRLK